MSSSDPLRLVLEQLKDTVPPEQLTQVTADLQKLLKEKDKVGKLAVQECIINVVGTAAYKNAALKVKAILQNDPTKEALNLDRYEELMEQAKARYALEKTEKVVGPGPDTEEYEKAKQQALEHLQERARQEAEAKGEFTFSGASNFKIDVASIPSTGKSTGAASKSQSHKSKAKGKSKGKAKASASKPAASASPAKPAAAAAPADSVFSFKPAEGGGESTEKTEGFNFGSLSIGSNNFNFGGASKEADK